MSKRRPEYSVTLVANQKGDRINFDIIESGEKDLLSSSPEVFLGAFTRLFSKVLSQYYTLNDENLEEGRWDFYQCAMELLYDKMEECYKKDITRETIQWASQPSKVTMHQVSLEDLEKMMKRLDNE